MAIVSVEEVGRGKALTRFLDVPQSLHGEDPRFVTPIQTWERYRVARRNPYFERGDAGLFMAWRDARVVGRIAAHVAGGPAEHGGEGRFGLWATVDDAQVAGELLAAAAEWLREQGCDSVSGPWSFTAADEPGILTEGHAHVGTTGRPWGPAWEAERLVEALGAGAEVVDEVRTWRLPVLGDGPVPEGGGPVPAQAGSYADRRLALEAIGAVPDVSAVLRGSRLASAWSLAKQVRAADWEGCTVVRCEGDPSVEVPRLQRAAGAAGYSWVVAPWCPGEGTAPETVHRRYRGPL